MDLLSVLVVLIIVGVALWFVNNKIPMDPTIKLIINIVVFLVVAVWLLQVFGIIGSLHNIQIR